jgi:cell division protein FtsQ|tara:strand:- start:642 stop:1364 length:723 start_codon:yes stop_codon:yes gene_type:complete
MQKLIEIVKWILLLSVIVLLMAFSVNKQKLTTCNVFDVEIVSSENDFIDSKTVEEFLKNKNLHPSGKFRTEIAIDEMEKNIANHPSVQNVNAFSDIRGNIKVEIKQRNPIVRVQTVNKSFYIDESGKKMPLSEVYTSRVLVITGNVNYYKIDELFLMSKFITDSPFWKAQIMQMHLEENEEITLIPRVGYQQIVFGKPINIEEKFRKLKLFYEKGISDKGWNNYSHINLKFKNQIVCTKK